MAKKARKSRILPNVEQAWANYTSKMDAQGIKPQNRMTEAQFVNFNFPTVRTRAHSAGLRHAGISQEEINKRFRRVGE